MAPPDDAAQRRALEGAAPLLEAARTQLRALVPALKAWRWEHRLRAVADIARQVVLTDAQVELALHRAQRRAAVEGWARGRVLTLLEELGALRQALREVLAQRLGAPTEPGAGLQLLLSRVLGSPRKVPLAQRELAAAEALSLVDGPVLASLFHLAATTKGVFSRPVSRGRRLPFSLEELEGALSTIDGSRGALEAGWAAVRRIDTSGGVERELLRRAGRAPRSPTRTPVQALVHATFWRGFADAELDAVVAERFAPVAVRADERRAAARFLLAREADGGARLEPPGPRAALLMLAHELTASPEGRAPLRGGAAQVGRWAVEADRLAPEDEDWRRLRDGLRGLAARSVRSTLPPLQRVGRPAPPRPALPERLSDFFPSPE